MLTQCGQNQPTFGHFVNGHYAMSFPPPPTPNIHSVPLTEWREGQPLCLYMLTSEWMKQRNYNSKSLVNTDNLLPWTCEPRTKRTFLCFKWSVSTAYLQSQRMCLCKACRSLSYAAAQPAEKGCDGNTNSIQRGKERQTDPKEHNDGENCFDKKRGSFQVSPEIKCITGLKHLLVHWSQTYWRSGSEKRGLFDVSHQNNHF